MDPQTFDRFARLMSTPRSRRTTWRTLLALALSGAALEAGGRVRAAPKSPPPKTCRDGDGSCRGDKCCGGECCPGRCFVEEISGNPFCCTESHDPPGAVCVNPNPEDKDHKLVCCPVGGPGQDRCACAGPTGIAGSYRRR